MSMPNNVPSREPSSVGFMVSGAGPDSKVQAELKQKLGFRKKGIGLVQAKGFKYAVAKIKHDMKYLFTGKFVHPKPVESNTHVFKI